MPFLITEPQRIGGTTLGYSVYPYHHSFDDHANPLLGNQKLVIFALKNSPFIETDHIVHQEMFKYENTTSGYVDERLKDFVSKHEEYVFDKRAVSDYFARVQTKNAGSGKQ